MNYLSSSSNYLAKCSKRLLPRAPILFLLLVLTACSSITNLSGGFWIRNNDIRSIIVTTESDSNGNYALALDIVFVMDEGLASNLPDQSPVWFVSKPELLNRYPKDLRIVTLNIAPNSPETPVELPPRHNQASAVILYVNNPTSSQSALELSQYRELEISIGRDRVKLVERY